MGACEKNLAKLHKFTGFLLQFVGNHDIMVVRSRRWNDCTGARVFQEVIMKKIGALLGFDPIKKQTNVRTEIIAGIVTFLAMAYILTVNPNQIFGGPGSAYWSSAFIATALGAVVGTLLMAFVAKMPLAQASGMGLNSLLGTIVGGGGGAYSIYVFHFTLGQSF